MAEFATTVREHVAPGLAQDVHYGARRSRLKGQAGARTSTGWSVLTYNLDTLAIRTA